MVPVFFSESPLLRAVISSGQVKTSSTSKTCGKSDQQPLSQDTCSNKSPVLPPDDLARMAKETFSNLINEV